MQFIVKIVSFTWIKPSITIIKQTKLYNLSAWIGEINRLDKFAYLISVNPVIGYGYLNDQPANDNY